MTKPALIEQHTFKIERTEPIALDALIIKGLQFRVAGLDDASVKAYAEIYANANGNDDVLPPIVVFNQSDGGGISDGVTMGKAITWGPKDYILADGHHRVAAAKKAGLTKLPAIVKSGKLRDAILYAAAANHQHGLRLTADDKRAITQRLLLDPEWSRWSDRQIAATAGVSPQLVAKIRKTVPSAQTTQRIAKNGRTTTATNSRKTAKARTADKQAAQESMADNAKLSEDRDAIALHACKIQHLNPKLAQQKCRIMAALYRSGSIHSDHCVTPTLDRSTLTELVGTLDVHPGQLSRAKLITGDHAEGYQLTKDGERIAGNAWESSIVQPKATDIVNLPDTSKTAASEQEPETITLVSLEERRAQRLRVLIRDRLMNGKIRRPPTSSQLMAMALLIGVESELSERWSHEFEMRADHLLATQLAASCGNAIFNGESALQFLPAIPDICQMFGVDHDSLRIQAERDVTE